MGEEEQAPQSGPEAEAERSWESPLAFQDRMRDNYCWGCGPLNSDGLRIQSRWEGEESVCMWKPDPSHAAGPREILNGGVIATILDCHSVCTAIADAYRREGRAIGSEPEILYVTAFLQVNYLQPTPLDMPVKLTARIKERRERRSTVVSELHSNGQETARAQVVAVRVPRSWSQLSTG